MSGFRLRKLTRHRRLKYEALEERRLLTIQGVEFYTDASLTVAGLVGSYVNESLDEYSAADDWRVSQSISGTRIDADPDFATETWGDPATVGVTHGSESDWDDFSVQWDGYLDVSQAGQRLATQSDDGSRMWIDLNENGQFEDEECFDNGWGEIQGTRIGERTPGLPVGTYEIRIQYYEMWGGNTFSLEGSPYIPTQFVETPDNPRQTIKVLVLDYDPLVPSEENKRMHEVFNWNDPRELAEGFERDLEWFTGGAVDVQITEWRELNEFPIFTDGSRYNPDEYVAMRRVGSSADWSSANTDFYAIAEQHGLESLVNSGQIDEVWLFGDHYFSLLGEAWMAGPGSFFVNGPTFSDVGFERAIAGYGFSYERGVAEMVHNLGHRQENHGQRAFGSWNLANPVTPWDEFSSNYLETVSGPYGVGTCHVPANADDHYDYGDERVVSSTAWDFVNYPNLTGSATNVGRDSWAMGDVPDYHRDYLNWYFAMMPGNAGTDADGRMANWYKYTWDFNSYESGTGLARGEDAFGAGAVIDEPGSAAHEFTVRYYDETGIDTGDIDDSDMRVTGPGGFDAAATVVEIHDEQATTAGTARTVVYQVQPPGGSWNLADNGVYRLMLQDSQVYDTLGNDFPGGEVGQFKVDISDSSVINVNAAIDAGEVEVTHTTLDIGPVSNLFDGNPSTLVRTPNIDPAVVSLSFDSPQTIRGFNAYFSHSFGDPAYTWQVETADNQADMDSQSGSWQQTVAATGTLSDTYSNVLLATPITTSVIKMTATRHHGDDYVHINEWQLLGEAVVDVDPPTAGGSFDDVTAIEEISYFIDVDFQDPGGVDASTTGSSDILVTGPDGWSTAATFYDVSSHLDEPSCTATYWFIPPDGEWDAGDNGTYHVVLQADEVFDIHGNAASTAVELGTFTVDVPPPQRYPLVDLTEENAADWTAWADGATADVSDDATRILHGEASVRFDTTGGFDTYMRYPASFQADWDLTRADTLNFSVYAENSNTFQENSPWIILTDVDGDQAEYRYYDNNGNRADILNEALNQWRTHEVPLDAPQTTLDGWRRFDTGSVDLDHIATVEFHADTWGAGFTLWYDGVGFSPDPTLPGDANGDGVVDVTDLGILATNYGTGGAQWHDGDFTGDNQVDVSDLGILATYYGQTLAVVNSVAASASAAVASEVLSGDVGAGTEEAPNLSRDSVACSAGLQPAQCSQDGRATNQLQSPQSRRHIAEDDIDILARRWMIAAEDADDEDEPRRAVFAEFGSRADMLGLLDE